MFFPKVDIKVVVKLKELDSEHHREIFEELHMLEHNYWRIDLIDREDKRDKEILSMQIHYSISDKICYIQK